jgi:hypothetical protein
MELFMEARRRLRVVDFLALTCKNLNQILHL